MARRWHPILFDIDHSNLEAVQECGLADGAVLEERESENRATPLIHAIARGKPAIALWPIKNRGQHRLENVSNYGIRALHQASMMDQAEVVEVLVAAGADPAALDGGGDTPLLLASRRGQPPSLPSSSSCPPSEPASIRSTSINGLPSRGFPAEATG